MLLAVGVCIGLVLGAFISLCILRRGAIGNLVIADDADEGPYLFLEISKAGIRELRLQQVVKLYVVDKGRITQK